MNTSWIRPGVKAIIIRAVNYPELIGEIVTIMDLPQDCHHIEDGDWRGVRIEEGIELAQKLKAKAKRITPAVQSLKPYHEPGSWDELESILGLDIRNPIKEKV
jgi:hypothetical protein